MAMSSRRGLCGGNAISFLCRNLLEILFVDVSVKLLYFFKFANGRSKKAEGLELLSQIRFLVKWLWR